MTANATPPPPPSSPNSPNHHPSIYIPPTPATHPTPPSRLTLEFDGNGNANFNLWWVGQASPVNPAGPSSDYTGPATSDDTGPSVTGTTKLNNTGPPSPPRCDTCGACGVVFSLFTRQKHHLPWVLYKQTQADHVSMGDVKPGTSLQLMTVASCGTVSVIITPYEPPATNATITDTLQIENVSSNGSGTIGDYNVHIQRYNTLAQHYANKTVASNRGHGHNHDNGAGLHHVSFYPSVIDNSSANPSRVVSSTNNNVNNNWILYYNASVNLTDLVYTNIWWDPKEVSTSNFLDQHPHSLMNQSSGNIEYLVSWEDASGTLTGNSVTKNHYSSFVLWPHTVYKIQVKINSGSLTEPSSSNTLIFDATKIYEELSAELKREQSKVTTVAPLQKSQLPDFSESLPTYAKQLEPFHDQATWHSDSFNQMKTATTDKILRNLSSNGQIPRTNSDSYVYANVDTDYTPLYVETVAYKRIQRPVSKPAVDPYMSSDVSIEHETIKPIPSSAELHTSSSERNTAKLFHQENRTTMKNSIAIPSESDNLMPNRHSFESSFNEDSAKIVHDALATETIAGIVSGFGIVIILIVILAFYMRYYVKSVHNKKGSFRADGYDTESSASSKGTEKSDNVSTSNKNDHQWMDIRHPDNVDKNEANYGFGGKYHETKCLDPNSSRTNSIEFSLHSSDSLLPANKYTSLSTNNTSSNLSGNTISTNMTCDPSGIIYGNGSDCSGNSSVSGGSYLSNVRYTNTPGGITNLRTQCHMPQTSPEGTYRMHSDYSEIVPAVGNDRAIYTVPTIPVVHPSARSAGIVGLTHSSHAPSHIPAVHPNSVANFPPQQHFSEQPVATHVYCDTDTPSTLGSYLVPSPHVCSGNMQTPDHMRSYSQTSQISAMVNSQLFPSHSRSHSQNSLLCEPTSSVDAPHLRELTHLSERSMAPISVSGTPTNPLRPYNMSNNSSTPSNHISNEVTDSHLNPPLPRQIIRCYDPCPQPRSPGRQQQYRSEQPSNNAPSGHYAQQRHNAPSGHYAQQRHENHKH